MPRLRELAESLSAEDMTRVLEYHRDLAYKIELDYAKELSKAIDERREVQTINNIEKRGKIYLLVRVIFDLLIKQPQLIDHEEMNEDILIAAKKLGCFEALAVNDHFFTEALIITRRWRAGLALTRSFLEQFQSLRETRVEIANL